MSLREFNGINAASLHGASGKDIAGPDFASAFHPRAWRGLVSRALASLPLAATLAVPLTAHAQSNVPQNDFTVSGGIGDAGIDIVGARVGRTLGTWNFASCTTFGEADIEYWWAENHGTAPGELTTIGALGGCRWSLASRISAEFGFGARLMSHVQIVEQKDYSTAFQFQTMGGLKLRLDDPGNYYLGFRLRHISNGAIKHPNSGINAALLSVTALF